MRQIILIGLSFLMLHQITASAQKVSVSTNLIDYACLGTFNIETSLSVSQHWSLTAGARYNPFTFRVGDPDRQFQYRQQSYSLGTRFWPWHSFSGWWVAGKLRYQEYNHGGIFSQETEEGDRAGMGLYAGYTYMISRHLNIEFGLGLWGGTAWYRRYSCPVCGLTTDTGRRWFLLPDDFMISLAYVF
jgi:hypothetical protein